MEEGGLPSRILDHFILFFGAWALAVHGSMLLKLSLPFAVTFFLIFYVIVLFVWRRWPAEDVGVIDAPMPPSNALWLNIGVASAAALTAAAWIFGLKVAAPVLWIACMAVLFLGVGATVFLRPSAGVSLCPATALQSKKIDRATLALATTAALVTVFIARPNADDSLYTALANRVMGYPFEPLLWIDPLHGFGLGGGLTDQYRVHAYEALVGALGLLTGIFPIKILHIFMPSAAVFLIVMAAGRLAKLLLFRDAIILLTLFVLFSFLYHNSYGFFRLQQGKHWLFMLMPLLIPALVIRFSQTGAVRHALVLVAASIAGSGLSSSGLYFMPTVIGASVLAAVLLLFRSVPLMPLMLRLAFTMTTAAYPLILTLALYASRISFLEASADVAPAAQITWNAGLLYTVLEPWLGYTQRIPQVFTLIVLPVVAAWAVVRAFPAMAVAAGLGIGFAIALYNPLAVATYQTVPELNAVYTRIQLIFPIIFFGAAMLVPLVRAVQRRAGFTTAQTLVSFFFGTVLLVQGPMLYSGGGFDWQRPTMPGVVKLKWPWETAVESMLGTAHCVADSVGSDRLLLAPEGIGQFVAMVPMAPPLVLNRTNNARWIARVVGQEEASFRLQLVEWMDGSAEAISRAPYRPGDFSRGLRELDIRAVAISPGNLNEARISELLSESGFAVSATCNGYQVWLRR